MPVTSTEAIQTLRLRNKTDEQQELWLEPLGDCIKLDPRGLYEVTATNAFEEIDLSSDGFTVYGWVTVVSLVEDSGNKRKVWELPK